MNPWSGTGRVQLSRARALVVASVLFASAPTFTVAIPAAAECPSLQTWPLFRDAAPSAHVIVTARVTQVLSRNRNGDIDLFRVEVLERIRGDMPSSFLVPGAESVGGCIPAALVVRPGDRLALAFGGRGERVSGPVSGVAFLSRLHDARLMPRMQRLSTRHVRQLAALPSARLLFFTADDGTHGRELWRTDGTSAGTVLVKDIRRRGSSDPRRLIAAGSMVYFTADDGIRGRELWLSDGTAAGTRIVADLRRGTKGSRPFHLTSFYGSVVFSALDGRHGREPWFHDAISGETQIVRNIHPDDGLVHGSRPRDITPVNGSLLFSADDGVHGREPWRTDYAEYGARPCGDLRPGPEGSDPQSLIEYRRANVFTADDGVRGRELWGCTDQFYARVLNDLDPSGSSDPHDLVSSDPHRNRPDPAPLFFVARDPVAGEQVFGLTGIDQIYDDQPYNPDTVFPDLPDDRLTQLPSGGPPPTQLVMSGNVLFFVAPDDMGISRLWMSRGTAASTVPIGESHGPINPDGLRDISGMLVFRATDPVTGTTATWISDGTASGTRPSAPLKDVTSARTNYVLFRDLLYIVGKNRAAGLEPWVSDRTLRSAHLLRDIRPGTAGSRPMEFTVVVPPQYP